MHASPSPDFVQLGHLAEGFVEIRQPAALGNTTRMESYEFLINTRPQCIWDWRLRDKNLAFVRGFDPDYFRYVAHVNAPAIEKESNHHAALSLRLTYSHALESFAALAGAAFQAPDCPLGWLLRYTNADLYAVVEKVTRLQGLPTRLGTPPSWSGLAEVVVQGANMDKARLDAAAGHLARLWARFAYDFLDQSQHDEYNSLKHGFRIRPGGFALRVGIEPSYGVSPPESEMETIGASEYGSSFYVVEKPVGGSTDIRPRNFARNWHPENLFYGLDLLAMSMTNILAFLRRRAQEDPAKIRFEILDDEQDYEAPWRHHAGVQSVNMDLVVEAADVTPSDAAAIKSRLGA